MKARPNVKTFAFQMCTPGERDERVPRRGVPAGVDRGRTARAGSATLRSAHPPEYYSAQILPHDATARVEEHCRQFMASHLSGHPDQRQKYEAVLSFMHQEDGSRHLPEFVEWMKRLDARRKERFVDVFPEWRELFGRHDG